MDTMVSDCSRAQEHLQRIGTALSTGVVLLASNREIAWMDKRTRARLNGGREHLASTLRTLDAQGTVSCCLCVHEVMINGVLETLCVIHENEAQQRRQDDDAVAAIEAAMADTSWFTRVIIEKLKALRQVNPPAARASDLDVLTDREREVLGLICEGRSDAQMSGVLNLSQNTVRNHIASLYRKIGVNRRSGAIIWARERGITAQDALGATRRTRPRPNHAQA
jgi:DNA-binding NarL/FixJ family response regulator